MASLEDLKAKVDLHDLAERLGVKRQGAVRGSNAVYHSPKRKDARPSLSIYVDRKGVPAWKDHATGEGGTCIDFVMYVEGIADVGEAIKRVSELSGIVIDRPHKPEEPQRERTRVDYIAEKCLEQPQLARPYLEERGILPSVVEAAIAKRSVGFNTWTNREIPAGQPMHGGPAVAFIVRTLNPGHVAAIDMRYLDPLLNGGVKTTCQGEKAGLPWTTDLRRLQHAETVYLVESPINALSVESAFEGNTHIAAVATRGVAAVDSIDWRFLRGKRALVCMDHRDKPNEYGDRPGLKAAWRLHELLTEIDVSALLIDQDDWDEGADVNDVLKAAGPFELQISLKKVEPWLIPGMTGDFKAEGRRRIYLPFHDLTKYGSYRVREDFTTVVTKWESTEEAEGEEGKKASPMRFADVAGFRVAAISRVSVASPTSTMTGEEDSSPDVLFAVSVQTPRHGAKLVRRVFVDERLHNVEQWKKLGPVFDQAAFLRMVNILERSAHIGARHATNFVGLAWKDGKLIVNEGSDCYFSEPEKQCPYHALAFPSGSPQDARRVLDAYQQTFQDNAALIALVWALGGHLKPFLGFWPHLVLQADKGAGKSTLVKRLERSIAFTMFSGQSLQTEFRLVTSLSHTSHPVGWEEISAREVKHIDRAVGLLQECYQYTYSTRGSEMTKFLLSAPVMLAGEDVPVRSLTGKIVRTDLTGRKGLLMPQDLPRFPVRQWLQYLASLDRAHVQHMFEAMERYCQSQSRGNEGDSGALRMATNYAAVATAWRLLCDWLELDPKRGDFHRDLVTVMNGHIKETAGDRAPWVWVVEKLLSEIAMNEFRFPYEWDEVDGRRCLVIRVSHVVDHMARTPALREFWNALPIKTDRVFKRQLQQAAAILLNEDGTPKELERTIGEPPSYPDAPDHRKRVAHMVALDLARLEEFGVYAVASGRLAQRTFGFDPPPSSFPPAPPDE